MLGDKSAFLHTSQFNSWDERGAADGDVLRLLENSDQTLLPGTLEGYKLPKVMVHKEIELI